MIVFVSNLRESCNGERLQFANYTLTSLRI